MTPSATARTNDPNQQAAPRAAAQPAPAVPFTRASREHQQPGPDNSVTLATAEQLIGPLEIPSVGFLRRVWLYVTGTTAGNAATTAFKEDGPWSVVSEVRLTDVNGQALLQVSGYELFLINKYGGYDFAVDPTQSPIYVATTGAGATGGSFTFALSVPLEIVGRSALGALENMNAAQTYRLSLQMGTIAAVYATAPTTPPVVRARTFVDAWTQPAPVGIHGQPQSTAPPHLGATQFWSRSIHNINAGQAWVRLPRMGHLIRMLILVFRDVTPVRSTAGYPDIWSLTWDQQLLMSSMFHELWRHVTSRRYSNNLDTGVLILSYCHEVDGKPGAEQADLWLPTTQATRLEFQGVFDAGGTLTILQNDVALARAA